MRLVTGVRVRRSGAGLITQRIAHVLGHRAAGAVQVALAYPCGELSDAGLIRFVRDAGRLGDRIDIRSNDPWPAR